MNMERINRRITVLRVCSGIQLLAGVLLGINLFMIFYFEGNQQRIPNLLAIAVGIIIGTYIVKMQTRKNIYAICQDQLTVLRKSHENQEMNLQTYQEKTKEVEGKMFKYSSIRAT